jgi:hypothetical protein
VFPLGASAHNRHHIVVDIERSSHVILRVIEQLPQL